MAERKGASLNPKDFITGGLLDDVDVTLKKVMFEMFDYEGKSDPAPSLGIDLVTGDEGEGDKPYRNHWSVGGAENWVPSDDGMEIIPIGKDTMPRKTSNLFFLVTSLLEAGVPESVLDSGRIDFLEGLKCHIIRKDPPKRGNLPAGGMRRGRDGKDYEKDGKVYAVSKIYEPYPWDSKKGATKAAKKDEKVSTGSDLDSKAKAVLVQLIAEGGGKTSKKEIPTKGFALIQADADKNKVLGLLFKDAWMTANGFAVDSDGTITLAA